MPSYIIRLVDGQTLNLDHKATTIQEFMHYLKKEEFVTVNSGAEEIGFSARYITTISVDPRRAYAAKDASPNFQEKVRTVG